MKIIKVLFSFLFLLSLAGCFIDNEEAEIFTVSFNSNGGSDVEDVLVEDGRSFLEPDSPVKEDAVFVGWCTDTQLENLYDFSGKVTSDLRLYAKWDELSYTVTIDFQYDNRVEDQVVIAGERIVFETPIREDKVFDGLYYGTDYINNFTLGTRIEQNETLYVKWIDKGFDLRIYVGSAIAYHNQIIAGEEINLFQLLPEQFFIENSILGVYEDSVHSVESNIVKMPNENLDLFLRVQPRFVEINLHDKNISIIDTLYFEVGEFNNTDFPYSEYENYEFKGWYADEEYTHEVDLAYLLSLDFGQVVDIYAYYKEKSVYPVAFITDSGSLDHGTYNELAFQGVVRYCTENNIEYKYYVPDEVSDDAYFEQIELAVESGAEVVVLPGFLFETSVYEAQYYYPDVSFILIDGYPHNATWTTFEIADNTVSYLFKEEEAGFLAGYAAVHDGFTSLGFMGGMAVPAVVKYGTGFVAGAYYAANELGIDLTFGDNEFMYLGSFEQSEMNKTYASSWYNRGIELIFHVAGGGGYSIMQAAEENGTYVVGVDVDQSSYSSTVLTSAMKRLDNAAYYGLMDYFNNSFKGGTLQELSIETNGLQLPMDTSRFMFFDITLYESIELAISNGTIVVPSDYASLVAFMNQIGATNYPSEETINP